MFTRILWSNNSISQAVLASFSFTSMAEEIDYESLPPNAGLAVSKTPGYHITFLITKIQVNMLAGALVNALFIALIPHLTFKFC